MKTKLIILTSLLLILISKVSYAQDSMSLEIVCDGRNLSVSGKLPDTSQSETVTLMLGNWDDLIYVDQQNTSDNGDFAFAYTMPENRSPGAYDIAVGSSIDIPTYYGKLYYGVTQNDIFTVDLNITLKAYVPTISGTISCSEGKTLEFTVLNITDNNVFSKEEITSEDGTFNLSYTLPSFISGKEYRVLISCKENAATVAEISANIDTSIFFVTVDGEVEVEDNVEIDTHIRTVNTNLINTRTTIKDNKNVSATFPNLLPNTVFKVIANGREVVPIQEELYQTTKSIDISKNDIVPYFVQLKSVENLADKIIVVEYPHDKLNLTDACVFTSVKETHPVYIELLGLNIKSVTDGRVEFVVSDNFIAARDIKIIISGMMFEATKSGAAEITCSISNIEEDN